MTVTDTIDTGLARDMVRANVIRGASIIGQPGGWSVVLKHGRAAKALTAQRSRQVRVWRSLDRCVDYLKTELGIVQIGALDASGFTRGIGRQRRPDRAQALQQAHKAAAYDAWLRTEVAASIADPRPSIPHRDVERLFSAKRVALRRKVAGEKR